MYKNVYQIWIIAKQAHSDIWNQAIATQWRSFSFTMNNIVMEWQKMYWVLDLLILFFCEWISFRILLWQKQIKFDRKKTTIYHLSYKWHQMYTKTDICQKKNKTTIIKTYVTLFRMSSYKFQFNIGFFLLFI